MSSHYVIIAGDRKYQQMGSLAQATERAERIAEQYQTDVIIAEMVRVTLAPKRQAILKRDDAIA